MSGKTYLQGVQGIAEECWDRFPDPDDDASRSDYIWDTMDSYFWIFYTQAAQEVLNQSDNEPNEREIRNMCGPNADWRQMRAMAASEAMGTDIWEALHDLDAVAKEEEEDTD